MQPGTVTPIGWIGTIVIAVLFVILVTALASYCFGVYNELVALRNQCDRQFANVDTLLKQRHDELPNLIDTCKRYIQDEQKPLQVVTEARSAYLQATTPAQKTGADSNLSEAIKGLFAVAENYPDLRADSNFMHLQVNISELEAQIAQQRTSYNEVVNVYNIRIAQVPANLIAALARFVPRPMYPVAEADKQDVKVSFA